MLRKAFLDFAIDQTQHRVYTAYARGLRIAYEVGGRTSTPKTGTRTKPSDVLLQLHFSGMCEPKI